MSIVPIVTSTSIILSTNKIQNGDILVTANPGPPGKWLLKRRERETESERQSIQLSGCFQEVSLNLVAC